MIGPRPTVFLSSVYGQLVQLRREVVECAAAAGDVDFWLAERDAPDLPELYDGLPEDEYRRRSAIITKRCLEAVRQSHAVTFVAGGYGSAKFPHADAAITILELELFQALLHLKPLIVFRLPSAQHDERLDGLLSTLSSVYPDLVTTHSCAAESDTPRQITTELRRALSSTTLHEESVHQFAERLRASIEHEMAMTAGGSLRFLDGKFVGIAPTQVKRPVIEEMIRDADTCYDEATCLAYLWVAVRHLAAVPYDRPEHVAWLTLWESVLRRWASAAAWYGLHGMIKLGRLAAVISLQDVQARLVAAGVQPDATIQGSDGAVASSYYSAAKLATTPEQRKSLLETAHERIRRQLKIGSDDGSGLLLIKGPIELQLGMRFSALWSCWKALNLRRALREPPGRIGEAETHVGLALLNLQLLGWPITTWAAKHLLQKGVRRLEENRRDGFLITAKKKLAYAYLATLNVREARRELEEAMQLARDRCCFDQILQLDAILRRLPASGGRVRVGLWLLRNRQTLTPSK